MTRFSIGGDGDENRRRPIGEIPPPKRPRLSPLVPSWTSSLTEVGGAAVASSSNHRSPLETGNSTRVQSISGNLQTPTQERHSTENLSSTISEHRPDSSSSDSLDEEDGQEDHLGAEEPNFNLRLNSTPGTSGRRVVELVQPRENPLARLHVTLDPDVLDCPICTEPLIPPVYQCENGHIACESCCSKMKYKCGSCWLPIGYNRCRALEKVIDSALIRCSNMHTGCTESINYGKRLDHEKKCIYVPCLCPLDDCFYCGFYKDLHNHLSVEHSASYKKILFDETYTFMVNKIDPDRAFSIENSKRTNVVLLEKNEKIVFVLVLSPYFIPEGIFGFIVCIAPTSSERVFYYEIAAEAGNCSLTARAPVENLQRWDKLHSTKKRLIVPIELMTSEPRWYITIWSDNPEAHS